MQRHRLRLGLVVFLCLCLVWFTFKPAAARFQNNPQQVTLIDVLACLTLFQNPGQPLTAQQIASGVGAILEQTIPANSFNPVPTVAECDFIAGSPTRVDLADVIALLVAFQNPGRTLTPPQLASGVNVILGSAFTAGDVLRVPENGSTPTPTPPSGRFTITLEFVDNLMTPAQQEVIRNAARRWEQVITGDLGNYVVPADLTTGFCASGSGGVPIPSSSFPLKAGRVINDVLIQVRVGLLGSQTGSDGQGNTLANAGPCGFPRPGSRLIPFGGVGFDPADLNNPLLLEIAVHEFGHILGIGTRWQATGTFPSLIRNGQFIGIRGTNQFQSYGGVGNPPVEQPSPAHWDENAFARELMTPALNSGGANPLSRVTLGALEDLGYAGLVYSAADPYTLGERGRFRDDVDLGDDIYIAPILPGSP